MTEFQMPRAYLLCVLAFYHLFSHNREKWLFGRVIVIILPNSHVVTVLSPSQIYIFLLLYISYLQGLYSILFLARGIFYFSNNGMEYFLPILHRCSLADQTKYILLFTEKFSPKLAVLLFKNFFLRRIAEAFLKSASVRKEQKSQSYYCKSPTGLKLKISYALDISMISIIQSLHLFWLYSSYICTYPNFFPV